MANQNRLYAMIREGKSFSGHERNCAFLNLRNGGFANVSATSGFDYPDDVRGVALVDWDHDGDLDCWYTCRNGPRVRFLRNDAPRKHAFLLLKLRGTRGNRDAIGARVEVVLADERHTSLNRTVYAGQGYLAQSSKMLHFGLGDAPQIEEVRVRWPGGQTESFAGLRPNRAYELVENGGVRSLEPLPHRKDQRADAAALPALNPAAAAIRATLVHPIPIPSLNFGAPDGREKSCDDLRGQPLLVNLWASWCPPCLAELEEWQRVREDFSRVGLQVLALNVDRLDPTRAADGDVAAAFLKKTDFSFATGNATEPTVAKCQLLSDLLWGIERPLPLPTSLLLNSSGELVAMYKGRVETVQLLSDARQLGITDGGTEPVALFPGRWLRDPRYDVVFLAARLLKEGFVEDALTYEREYRDRFAKGPRTALLRAKLGTALVEQGKSDEGLAYLTESVAMDPDSPELRNDLATLLQLQGREEEALDQYRQALRLDHDSPLIHENMSKVLLARGDVAGAVRHLRETLRLRPGHASAHVSLAEIMRKVGKHDAAIDHYRQALKEDKDDARVHQNLGALLMSRRQVAEAVKSFEAAVQLAPDNASMHKNLGLALALSRQPEEAVHHLQESIRLNPDDASVHNNLGGLYAQLGDPDSAVACFTRAVALAPGNKKYQRNLAAAREMQSQLPSELESRD